MKTTPTNGNKPTIPIDDSSSAAPKDSDGATGSLRQGTPTPGTNTASASPSASEVMTQPNESDTSANKIDLADIPKNVMGSCPARDGLIGFLNLSDIKALVESTPTIADQIEAKPLLELQRLVNKAETMATQSHSKEDAHELLMAIAQIKIDLNEDDDKVRKTLVNAAVIAAGNAHAIRQLSTTIKMQLSIQDMDNARITLDKAANILSQNPDDPKVHRFGHNAWKILDQIGDKSTLATLYFALGDKEQPVHSLEQAKSDLEQLSADFVPQAQDGTDPRGIDGYAPAMKAFARIGAIAKRLGLSELSDQMYSRANTMNEQYSNPHIRCRMSLDIADAQVDEGDHEGANRTFDRWPADLLEAVALDGKAKLQLRMEDSEGARATLRDVKTALELETADNNSTSKVFVHLFLNLADNQIKAADDENAKGTLERAIQLSATEDDPNSLTEIASLCLRVGHLDDMHALLDRAIQATGTIQSASTIEEFEDRADSSIEVAKLYLEAGEIDRANSILHELRNKASEIIDSGGVGSAVDVVDTQTDDDSSIESTDIAESIDTDIAESIDYVLNNMMMLRTDIADHQMKNGQEDGARQTLAMAREESAMINDNDTKIESDILLAKIHSSLGEVDIAAQIIEGIDISEVTYLGRYLAQGGVAKALIDVVNKALDWNARSTVASNA